MGGWGKGGRGGRGRSKRRWITRQRKQPVGCSRPAHAALPLSNRDAPYSHQLGRSPHPRSPLPISLLPTTDPVGASCVCSWLYASVCVFPWGVREYACSRSVCVCALARVFYRVLIVAPSPFPSLPTLPTLPARGDSAGRKKGPPLTRLLVQLSEGCGMWKLPRVHLPTQHRQGCTQGGVPAHEDLWDATRAHSMQQHPRSLAPSSQVPGQGSRHRGD